MAEKRTQQSDEKDVDKLYLMAQEDTVSMCLYNPDAVSRVIEITNPEHFSDDKMRAIMSAIVSVHRLDESVTIISVAQALEKTGELNFVGGVAFLYTLYAKGETVSISNTPNLIASVVREEHVKSTLREMLEESSGDLNSDSGVSARDAAERIQSEISQRVAVLNDDSSTTSAQEFVGSYADLLRERKRISEENREVSGGLQGIPTLLPSLNKYTSGYTPGQLVTVGAKTGVGKSVFAIMTAIAAIKANKSVLFFSLEMSQNEIFDRIYANMSAVELNKIKSGELDSDEERRIMETSKELEKAKFTVDADPKATIDYIRSKASRKQQSAEGLDLIIVDYLQLISPSGRYNSRQEFVADLSRNMKLMAKTLDIPVMILVQLNRQKSDAEDDRPTLDQIRESGAIAQDSDIVIFLHREKDIDNKVPQTLVMLEKNRSGESNKTIRCHTELAYSDFREVKKRTDLQGDSSNEEGQEESTGENTSVADFYSSSDFPADDFDDADDFFDDE